MNYIIKNLECVSCRKKCLNLYELNKHLQSCDLYDEWLKTYIPPGEIKCEKWSFYHIIHKYNSLNLYYILYSIM